MNGCRLLTEEQKNKNWIMEVKYVDTSFCPYVLMSKKLILMSKGLRQKQSPCKN